MESKISDYISINDVILGLNGHWMTGNFTWCHDKPWFTAVRRESSISLSLAKVSEPFKEPKRSAGRRKGCRTRSVTTSFGEYFSASEPIFSFHLGMNRIVKGNRGKAPAKGKLRGESRKCTKNPREITDSFYMSHDSFSITAPFSAIRSGSNLKSISVRPSSHLANGMSSYRPKTDIKHIKKILYADYVYRKKTEKIQNAHHAKIPIAYRIQTKNRPIWSPKIDEKTPKSFRISNHSKDSGEAFLALCSSLRPSSVIETIFLFPIARSWTIPYSSNISISR